MKRALLNSVFRFYFYKKVQDALKITDSIEQNIANLSEKDQKLNYTRGYQDGVMVVAREMRALLKDFEVDAGHSTKH